MLRCKKEIATLLTLVLLTQNCNILFYNNVFANEKNTEIIANDDVSTTEDNSEENKSFGYDDIVYDLTINTWDNLNPSEDSKEALEKLLNNSTVNKGVEISQDTLKNYKYSDSVEDAILGIETAINVSKEMDTEEMVLTCLLKASGFIKEMGASATNEDMKHMGKGSRAYNIVVSLRNALYARKNSEQKIETLQNIAYSTYDGFVKNAKSIDYVEYILIDCLMRYNNNSNVNIASMNECYEELYRRYINMLNNFVMYADYDLTEVELPPLYSDGYTAESINLNMGYSFEYKAVGNKCLYVQTTYLNDKIIEKKESEVEKADYAYCGIDDYTIYPDDTDNPNTGIVVDYDYIYGNQNEDSDKYVYYTITKNENTPYYYNSGIKTTEDGELSFNQLRDSIYQMSIKLKGKSIDTNEKSLFIFEGKPLVIHDRAEDLFTQYEVESILDEFETIGLKIDTQVSNGSYVSASEDSSQTTEISQDNADTESKENSNDSESDTNSKENSNDASKENSDSKS
jgi:hypothetical protein